MANLDLVKIVEICRVAPQPASAAKSLPLTFFDLRWLRFGPFQRLFFYELASGQSFSTILPRLKTSLSLTLHHFSPLAGSLTWPQDSPTPILAYVKGDTVSLTVAEYYSDENAMDDHFLRLSSSDFIGAKEYYSLVPGLDVSTHHRVTALALQITLFPNHGFSIGTAMHHAVLDGNSSTLFFKSWAYICRHLDDQLAATSSSLLPDNLKPCYNDRSAMKDPMGLEAIYSNQWLAMGGTSNRSLKVWELKSPPASIRATFEFTQAKVQTIRQYLKASVINSDSLHLSPFALACAYTWVCLIKAEEPKCDKALIVFNVDCRSRLDPPISANYFGNCVARCAAVAETEGLLGDDHEGLVVAAKAISEAILGLKNEGALLHGADSWVSRVCTVQGSDKALGIAGSPKFRIYETDFGWGRPKRTEVVTIDKTGAMTVSDSKNGRGGLEVGLVLEDHRMRVFASLFAEGIPLIN